MKKIFSIIFISTALGCGSNKKTSSTQTGVEFFNSTLAINYLNPKEEVAAFNRAINNTALGDYCVQTVGSIYNNQPRSSLTLSLEKSDDSAVLMSLEFELDSKIHSLLSGLEPNIICAKNSTDCRLKKLSLKVAGKKDVLGNEIEPDHVISIDDSIKDSKFNIKSCTFTFNAAQVVWQHSNKDGTDFFASSSCGQKSAKTTLALTCSNGEKNVLKADFKIKI